MYDINKEPLRIGNKVQVVKEIKYGTTGPTIKVGTIGYVNEFTTNEKPEDKNIEVKSDEAGTGFIISGSYLKKVDPSNFEKDLLSLFQDIIYQTEYMTDSWGDTSMLSRMAIEDKISPWSINSEVLNFMKKHNVKKEG